MIQFDRPPIVVDTNVVISAMLFSESISAKALDKALTHYLFVQSEETLSELASTVRRKKFDKYKLLGEREQFLLTISRASKIVDITCTVSDCRDPKDNRFLELALSTSSTLIVSGDDDLLSMHPYKGVDVVNPSTFLAF
jgi:uncharacterized protein